MMSFFQHLFLVMASAVGLLGAPMPLPLPPLPEDPALLRTAPADCQLFVQWFGSAAPAASPTNRSERLAAEPEVRAMITRLVAATRTMLDTDGGQRPRNAAMLTLFDTMVDAVQRPGCLFVSGLQPVAAGLVVHYGDAAGPVEKTLRETMRQLLGSETTPERRTVLGIAFDTISPGPDAPWVGWAMVDGYLTFAIGQGTAEQMVAGLRGESQGLAGLPALQQLRPGCKVERPVLRTYAAVAKLADQISFAKNMWQPLGMRNATAALAESGLEGPDFVSRLQLTLPVAEGLLGDLRAKPLSQDDLVLIPDDATVALAMRGSENSFTNQLQNIIQTLIGQDIRKGWDSFVARAESRSGVDFQRDLIDNAGDCTVAWSSPGQGGIGFSGLVAAVPLRDGERFAERLDAMWEKMQDVVPNKAQDRAEGQRIAHRAYLERFEHRDHPVWWIEHCDRDIPFAFSWTRTRQHFLAGLLPQPVRSAIDSSLLPNFDHALARRPLIARRGEATAMLYLELGDLLRQTYAPALMMLEIGSIEWEQAGFDFDVADVPRLQALAPHLGPELVLLQPTETGCMLTRRGSMPVFDALLVTCSMACLMQIDQ